jgi:ribosome-associated translation inhibitor RaiA
MFPVQITFRNMDPVLAVEELIRERADHLHRFHGRILSCRVVVEPPPRRHRGTTPYRVKVDLSLPGEELVASSALDDAAGHADLPAAVRNAFDGITRRLHDYVSRQRDRNTMPAPGGRAQG